jgi:hypothetical protein
MNLFSRTKVKQLWTNFSTNGGEAAASTYIDMAGWNGCMFLLSQGTSDASSTGQIKIRDSSAMSTGGAYVTTRTSAVRWDDSSGVGLIVMDCYKPQKRYLSVKPEMSSGPMMGWAICYGGRRQASSEAIGTDIYKHFVIAMTS